jgi:hypothetical protein
MSTRRRAVMLAVAVMIMGLVTALVSLLAISAAQRYRERQADRVRVVAQQLADTAVTYARLHAAEWQDQAPEKPIELDVKTLIPGRLDGGAVLTFARSDAGVTCHVAALARWAAFEVLREREVPLAPSTRPAR